LGVKDELLRRLAEWAIRKRNVLIAELQSPNLTWAVETSKKLESSLPRACPVLCANVNGTSLSLVMNVLKESVGIVEDAAKNVAKLNVHRVVEAEHAEGTIRLGADEYASITLRYDLRFHKCA